MAEKNLVNDKGIAVDKRQVDSLSDALLTDTYDIGFTDNTFKGKAKVFNSCPYYNLDFRSSTFDSALIRNPLPTLVRANVWKVFGASYPMCNIMLGNTSFERFVSFRNERMKALGLKNAKFKGTIDLFNASFADSSDRAFSGSYFNEGVACVLNPEDFSLANLKINWTSVTQIYFPFTDDFGKVITPDSLGRAEESINAVERFYGLLTTQARAVYNKQDGIADKLSQKLNHDAIDYKLPYYFRNHQFGKYSMLMIPEFFVRKGYNGESRFFRLTLFVVLIFSLIYFFASKDEVIKYFMLDEKMDDAEMKKAIAEHNKKHLKNYLKCIWFSSVVLISPKFSQKFFRLNGGVFFFLVVEWLLGLVMIILFLWFIAGNYPVVKTLVGI